MKKRIFAMLISIAMVLGVCPVGAAANVCYIDRTGERYESLNEAIREAEAGDTIWMVADDPVTTSVEINKSITIELEGFTLTNTSIKFTGNNDIVINDRVGTAKINNSYSGYSGVNSTDFSISATMTAALYLTDGARVTISGVSGGTEFNSASLGNSAQGRYYDKTVVVGKNCELTINGATFLYSGYTGSDGIFVCENAMLTINDVLVKKIGFDNAQNGGSLSYANAPTTTYPLTIVKGHFMGGMWLEKSTTINGTTIPYGTLSLDNIEKCFLYTSDGSYIDKEKSTNKDIYIYSDMRAEKGISNSVDADGTIRAAQSGDISVAEGQRLSLEPYITGGNDSTITYAWTFNGEPIEGAAAAKYIIEAVDSSDNGIYVCTATQSGKSVVVTYNIDVALEWTDGMQISAQTIVGTDNSEKPYVINVTGIVTLTGRQLIEGYVKITGGGTIVRGFNNTGSGDATSKAEMFGVIGTADATEGNKLILENITLCGGIMENEVKLNYNADRRAIYAEYGAIEINLGTTICHHVGTHDGTVYAGKGSSCVMNGGVIEENGAKNGGAVYVDGAGNFVINNGQIRNNYAQERGGAVKIYNYLSHGVFTMNGGEITGNKSKSSYAHGISCEDMGVAEINGGKISGNYNGRGIYTYGLKSKGHLAISGEAVVEDKIYVETYSQAQTMDFYLTSPLKDTLKIGIYCSYWTTAQTFDGLKVVQGKGYTLTKSDYNYMLIDRPEENHQYEEPYVTYTMFEDNAVVMSCGTWVTDTDAGYYKDGDNKLGVVRFLFDIDVGDDTIETGVRYVPDDEAVETEGDAWVVVGRGNQKTFYVDFTGITDEKEYSAQAFAKIGDNTLLSDVLTTKANFERLVKIV